MKAGLSGGAPGMVRIHAQTMRRVTPSARQKKGEHRRGGERRAVCQAVARTSLHGRLSSREFDLHFFF